MNILGIESSCDETSAAVVQDGRKILSNVVYSQIQRHGAFGGVVPEIACREHVRVIDSIVAEAMTQADVTANEIGAIAVATQPGLVGALLIGISFAKSLAAVWNKPLISVDHLHGHIYSALMDRDVEFPVVSLLVSGGHTAIYLTKSYTEHLLLGATLDDASGEAFDKVSKILELGYPGGPLIDARAKMGNREAVKFQRPMLDDPSFDFSFSGIKTYVLYYVHGQDMRGERRKFSEQEVNDLCASFQEAVVEVLVRKTIKACKKYNVRTVTVSGGVAANSRLREMMKEFCDKNGFNFLVAPMSLCGDNAAMIAGLGYHLFKSGQISDLYLDAVPTKNYRTQAKKVSTADNKRKN